jgi:hypothetical protein
MKRARMKDSGVRVLLLVVLALTGCQSARAQGFDGQAAHSPLAQVSPDVLADSAPGRAESVGRLAYVGADGNVYVTSADGGSTIAVTSDSESPPEGQGRSYHRIAWSPSGWLAFASVTREGNDARGALYVVESPGRPARLVAESDTCFIGYIYWSPAACPGRPDCQRLAYLTREGTGVGLHLVEISPNGVENRLLAVGRPIFFSWSADGRRMLWYTDGVDGASPHPRVTLYDVEREVAEVLPGTPGSGLGPAWSATGEHWLVLSSVGGRNQLQSAGLAGVITVIAEADNEIVYSWSPSGEQVAYAVRESDAEPLYGPIHLFDTRTGLSRQVTDRAFRILGFFWAPDGQRLGYLTWLDLPEASWAQWRTIDVQNGEDRGFAAFNPSPWMRRIVAAFGQQGQSHRFWSPDSRYLVYSERDEAQVDRVWMVDTWAVKGAKPVPVGEGVIGFWSWED